MNRVQTVAGVVLTLNEEHNLARALSSLSWCDELLVVDSGSIDHTREVAYQCGAKFLERIQNPPFLITDQRNWVLNHAGLKSDWILFLDADEEIGSSLSHQIISTISTSSAFDAYELTPRYWFFGQWLKRTQGYPNWHPRMVRRGHANFHGGVWETFSPATRVGRISEPYEHYAFSKGLDDWIRRHLRYADEEAQTIVAIRKHGYNAKLKSTRYINTKKLLANIWILRPCLRFLQKYFLNLGFTERWQALLYSLLMFVYEIMIVVKVIELLESNREN